MAARWNRGRRARRIRRGCRLFNFLALFAKDFHK
jgi:hypothetical protein